MADISGKGVSAALLMANFQALIHTLINKHSDMKDLVNEINASVNKITKGDKFLTFFIAKVYKKERKLKYINAGHFPPYLVNGNKEIRLDKGTTVIGAFDELPFIEEGEVQLEDDMVLLTFTDGLTDIVNEEGEFFDEEVVSEFLSKNWQHNAQQFNDNLLQSMDNFRGEQTFPDDIAVLTCKFDFNKRD